VIASVVSRANRLLRVARIPSGAKQAAEKGWNSSEVAAWASAGAEAHTHYIGFIGTTKVVPCYKAGQI
jgi:hypothetical protein